jgi:hypothetical protein
MAASRLLSHTTTQVHNSCTLLSISTLYNHLYSPNAPGHSDLVMQEVSLQVVQCCLLKRQVGGDIMTARSQLTQTGSVMRDEGNSVQSGYVPHH